MPKFRHHSVMATQVGLRNPIILGNVLPDAELDTFIQMGRHTRISDSDGAPDNKKARITVTSQSDRKLEPNQMVRLADSIEVALKGLPHATPIHCPMHIDHNHSAMAITNNEGSRALNTMTQLEQAGVVTELNADNIRTLTPEYQADMTIIFTDRALFACRRFYNRTVGAHIIGWSHNRLMIFGYSFMFKRTVDAQYSKQASENLRAGLSADEYREVCRALEIVSMLPSPELPNCTYSERKKIEHGIRLLWNHVYVFQA